MNLNLSDKVIIISGSSRGIGKGIANVLLEESAKVVITGLDNQDIYDTFDEFQEQYPERILIVAGDLNDSSVLSSLEKAVIDKWSRIDGLIANAGAVKPVGEWDISSSDWNWYFETNFSVAVSFVNKFIPHLKSSEGNIVFTSSIAGLEDIGAPLPYSSAKAALTMYAKGLARKLAHFKIRVNSIAPGNVLFPGGNWDQKLKNEPSRIKALIKQNVPLNTIGTPDDIANMAAFLLSDKVKFIAGSCMVVDGGQTAKFV